MTYVVCVLKKIIYQCTSLMKKITRENLLEVL